MQNITNQDSIKSLTAQGRYPDVLVKNLHLWVKNNGNKYWIYRFKINQIRKDMSLGPYPKLSLDKARELAILAKNKTELGIDPLEEKQAKKKQSLSESIHPTFEVFALDYIAKRKSEWSNEKHANQWLSSLQRFAFPVIGKMKLKILRN